jgi:hypothetical protein
MQLTLALDLALREQERYLSTSGRGFEQQAGDGLGSSQKADHTAPSRTSRRRRPRAAEPAPAPPSAAGRRAGDNGRGCAETRILDVSRPGDHGVPSEERGLCVPGQDHPAALDAAQARVLTERIKSAVAHISRLLLEAHDGRAWLALGYETWAAYVEAEFKFSKQRSFQLIDHARFIRALEAATGGSTMVDLPERISRGLKPHLSSIIAAIRSRTMTASDGDLHTLVEDVVREERLRLLSPDRRPHRPPVSAVTRRARLRSDLSRVDPGLRGERARKGGETAHLQLLVDALAVLANMPPCADVLAVVTDARALANLEPAVSWLASFARQWEALISHQFPSLTT